MKKNYYQITFRDRTIGMIHAFTSKEARILAQAEQIKLGYDYKIEKIKQINKK